MDNDNYKKLKKTLISVIDDFSKMKKKIKRAIQISKKMDTPIKNETVKLGKQLDRFENQILRLEQETREI